MSVRTLSLDQKSLEDGIAALSSAAHSFQLTRFERLLYRTLVVSVEVAVVSFLIALVFGTFLQVEAKRGIPLGLGSSLVLFGVELVFSVAFLVGTVSLVLNIPLFYKTHTEAKRLKMLGLAALSTSLWKESRRSHWIRRVRSALVVIVAVLLLLFTGFLIAGAVSDQEFRILLVLALFYFYMAALLFGARYLRNQRERMDLATSAMELSTAFEAMRQRARDAAVVRVPSDLLDQAARIESAQIAQARQDAVLRSVAARPHGYAIAFDTKAAEQRTALDIDNRVEFEDLVEQLSTEGVGVDAQNQATGGELLRATTSNGRVEIAYLLDLSSRRIRIVSVRPVAGAPSRPKG
jgi:hypothetical protein